MLEAIERDPLVDALIRAHPERRATVPKGDNPILTLAHAASRHSGYSAGDILSHRRGAPLCRVRHIVMYLAHQLTALSYPKIAGLLGNRDHTTIMHGVRKVERLIHFDVGLSEDIAAIRALAAAADPELGFVE